jgi:predicted pyridoxine 5'-phosphate oxidase superfamily flavin-nucleotide-binding protein
MSNLPAKFIEAWQQREPRMILTTVDTNNMPNAIWVLCVKQLDDQRILIANNFFSKTLENINNGSKGSLLMIAPEREAYQIKGSIEYYTSGPIYDDMKAWLDPKFAGVGAAVLSIDAIFYGAERVF